MFYNEHNKHVRTKKEIFDDNGNIRKGCKIINKGEVYERTLFTAKNKLFKQESFVDEVKRYYTGFMNSWIDDDKEKLHVFDKDGLYLATKKIGKNNPQAEQIQADNEIRMSWNREVDRAIISEVPEAEIRQIKTQWIIKRIKAHITIFGNQPAKLAEIILYATNMLSQIITKTLEAARAMKEKLLADSLAEKPEQKTESSPSIIIKSVTEQVKATYATTSAAITETKPIELSKSQLPPKPKMSLDAAAYERLRKNKAELDRQNNIIFEAERQRNLWEFERDDLRGFAKLTKKRELDNKIAQINEQIDILKIGLSNLVRTFGFANMQEFYIAYRTSQQAYYEYQDEVTTWEKTSGETARQKTESVSERLQMLKGEAGKQNANTFNYHHSNRSKDRGAR